MKIAIVGGGAVGITTALQLKDEFRNSDITVHAASFDDTTSHVAAGIFRVGTSYSGPTEELTRTWINDSWKYYDEIRKSRESAKAGIANMSCYMFANSRPQAVRNDWMERLFPVYRLIDETEFKIVGGEWKYGAYFETMITRCESFLPWARNKLQEKGVKFVEKEIQSFGELSDSHNLIMNCTGLASRELCNDKRVVPIRGQITRIRAPWIKTAFYGELDTYIVPALDGSVILGGSRGYDSNNKEVCSYEAAAIYDRSVKLLPSIKKAPILGHSVGLRPHRENNVRVEMEKMTKGNSNCTIVHNYGHGGYGVCTAPGTAKFAISLAKSAHTASGSKL
ncbi:D-aspartate oxidase [Venturia canescens]|uniref:D-aspartate oxidase n=1 Tax=Venturia canescens TaxID=32260 RepID=UPI001C9C4C66|nr:D-aspartate oxidase [Venturia canescens]